MNSPNIQSMDSMYGELILSISSKLEEEFETKLFKASLRQLEDIENPIRYNSFAYSFRELTRHVFKRLAPDEKVTKCTWYKNETDNENGITRVQRMLYAIKGGLPDDFIEKQLNITISTITARLKKVIDNLSKYTHIERKTFDTDIESINNMTYSSLASFDEFFITIETLKNEISSALECLLQNVVEEIFTEETFSEIDILSTHSSPNEAYIGNICIIAIDESLVSLEITGKVGVRHQYGSSRDQVDGLGLVFNDSYPFSISTTVSVLSPLDICIDAKDIIVDTSQFYE